MDLVWTQIASQALMNGHQKSKAYIPKVLEEKDVRRYYTQGPNSFVSILPHPDVTTQSLGSCKFAYIHAEQTSNHLLGLSFQCHYFCAGYDDDWCAQKYLELVGGCPNRQHSKLFLQQVRKEVKTMVS